MAFFFFSDWEWAETPHNTLIGLQLWKNVPILVAQLSFLTLVLMFTSHIILIKSLFFLFFLVTIIFPDGPIIHFQRFSPRFEVWKEKFHCFRHKSFLGIICFCVWLFRHERWHLLTRKAHFKFQTSFRYIIHWPLAGFSLSKKSPSLGDDFSKASCWSFRSFSMIFPLFFYFFKKMRQNIVTIIWFRVKSRLTLKFDLQGFGFNIMKIFTSIHSLFFCFKFFLFFFGKQIKATWYRYTVI